jgi:hypothetical protein
MRSELTRRKSSSKECKLYDVLIAVALTAVYVIHRTSDIKHLDASFLHRAGELESRRARSERIGNASRP